MFVLRRWLKNGSIILTASQYYYLNNTHTHILRGKLLKIGICVCVYIHSYTISLILKSSELNVHLIYHFFSNTERN